MGSLVSLTSKSSICSVFSFKAGPPLGVRPSVACSWRNPSSVQPQERDQTSKSPGDVTSSALRSNTFFSLSFTCESIFPAPADISIYEPGPGPRQGDGGCTFPHCPEIPGLREPPLGPSCCLSCALNKWPLDLSPFCLLLETEALKKQTNQQ